MITEVQEQAIIDAISKSNIRNESLKNDLTDHICCLVEAHLAKGASFENALQASLIQTAPGGLDEIERETIFLLNYNKIIKMKKLMYATGYLFTLAWISGMVLKTLHLMGAGMLLAIGAAGLVFLFFPLYLVNRYKYLVSEVLSEKMKWILGALSMTLLVLAITMKMLHLPGAALLLIIGSFIFGFGFLPFFFFKMYRNSVEQV